MSSNKTGFIIDDVMAMSPFLCCMDGKIHTNAEVENHFASSKRVMKTGTRLPIAAFACERYKTIKQKMARIV